MKISHLLQDLNEAGPRTAAQQATMKAAATGQPQANNPFNLRVVPGGASSGTGNAAPAPAAPKKTFMQRAGDAAQGVSNVIQKGAANASQNIPGVANWAGNLAQNVAPGINKVVGATGNVISKGGQAVGNAATGLAKGVQGVGDLAGAVGGAITQPIGGLAGGLKRGYQQATGNQPIGGAVKNAVGWQSQGGTGGGSAGGAGGVDPVQDLKNRIDAMDKRLKRAGIQEKRKN